MEITAREKIMFKVMKAIYESNIPIDFKGSMVLKACLMQAGYTDAIRHTEDIDGRIVKLTIKDRIGDVVKTMNKKVMI